MSGKIELNSVTKIFEALGSPIRMALVKRLSTAETFAGMSISELAEGSGLTRQAITKHLEALEDVGLVARRKPGRATWYELKTAPINRAIEALVVVTKQRERSLQRLKSAKEKIFGTDS